MSRRRGTLAALRRFVDQYLLGPWWARFDLPRVVDSLGDPDHLHLWMRRCLRYRHDRDMHGETDYWQAPLHTFTTRQGDCEDWAVMAHHVFEQRGLRARLFVVYTPAEGHAVCVVRYRRFWWTLCNRGLRRVLATGSLDAAGERALAEVAATSIYPTSWQSCAFVARLDVIEQALDGTPWRVEPDLRWVVAPPDADADAARPRRGAPPPPAADYGR